MLWHKLYSTLVWPDSHTHCNNTFCCPQTPNICIARCTVIVYRDVLYAPWSCCHGTWVILSQVNGSRFPHCSHSTEESWLQPYLRTNSKIRLCTLSYVPDRKFSFVLVKLLDNHLISHARRKIILWKSWSLNIHLKLTFLAWLLYFHLLLLGFLLLFR